MPNNSSNTVVRNLDVDIFLSDYTFLKYDNIKPNLLKELRQIAERRMVKLILIREPNKSVKHPEGILLSELISYKDELTEYYLEVSNGEDYDLMRKRIDKIIYCCPIKKASIIEVFFV